ncbi:MULTISPECIES: helix-turn-helix transcriptional regulator [Glycomyces]|uniref:Helix-turn-helix transcriptional regulator n=2 Tax=Glycomyces TaxID=58113 RepID=A0A9X3TA49_9ACTN|nr:helix-turn-helix transcriptional regulator [Glycomyces lechevalierae]MDA1387283.1 helix-turn-helix transcriptional regulator [Glycomyces lechevalierae]MDR7340033.1 transcriptional regulator with XRE-family HTH domain [Glycomyces lechevalierae]
MDRQQLADFLKTRRAALKPRDVGLPEGSRRRTPGLRRQEVAQLAGISVEYYIRLEQARGPKPSRQVLGALARALMLVHDERAHLYNLADERPDTSAANREVPATIRNLLAGLDDFPAYAVNAAYDMVAWNPLADRLMGWLSMLSPEQRNILRSTFSGSNVAAVLADSAYAGFVRQCVADVRASLARDPADAVLRALVDELLRSSPEFGELWADHEVRVRSGQTKRVVHQEYGPLEFDCQVLEVPGSCYRVIFYVPQPGSRTAEVFATMAALTQVTAETSGRIS